MQIHRVRQSWTADPARTVTVLFDIENADSADARCVVEAFASDSVEAAPVSTAEAIRFDSWYRADVSGLAPATRYTLRISASTTARAAPIREVTTRTAPETGTNRRFSFAFVGDTGLAGRPDGNATGTERVYREILADDPLFVLGGGDYAYANKDGRFDQVRAAVDEWLTQAEGLISSRPFFPQYGNHEIVLGERFEDWGPRFAVPNSFEEGRCYSFFVSGVAFVSMFAPNNTPKDHHVAWLESTLRNIRSIHDGWLVVYHHEALYAHGRSHPTHLNVRHMLAPLYETYGVDLVLNAHDQNYERTYPLRSIPHDPRPASTSLDRYRKGDGVIFAKVSPGGKRSEIGNRFSPFMVQQQPFMAVRDDTAHHYALIEIGPADDLICTAYSIPEDDGEKTILDRFTITASPRQS